MRRRREVNEIVRGAALILLGVAAAACATSRSQGFERLPEAEKARFARYAQFMTERQQERFLALESPEERDAFIGGMRVEERLSLYPPAIREAIWAREVLPGMGKEAVMLSWGAPERVEKSPDPLNKGLPDRETWYYRGKRELKIIEGLVVEVKP